MSERAATSILDLAGEQYLLLTTFTRDGRPKPTPVWAARDGDALVVITEPDAWKVRRLRHTPRATLAPCDARGRRRGDVELPAAGTVVEAEDAAHVLAAIRAKYGIQARGFELFQSLVRIVRRRPRLVPAGIELRDPAQTSAPAAPADSDDGA